jgi:hypothetical protein
VVEATLKGEAERIRAFTIAVGGIRARQDFDPQSDPIVRVEAARLRRAIELYYNGPARTTRSRSSCRAAAMCRAFAIAVANAREPRAASAVARRRRPLRALTSACRRRRLAGADRGALGGTLLLRLAPTRQVGLADGARRARAGAPRVRRFRACWSIRSRRSLPRSRPRLRRSARGWPTRSHASTMSRSWSIPRRPYCRRASPARRNHRLALGGERAADGSASVTLQSDRPGGGVVWSRSFEHAAAPTRILPAQWRRRTDRPRRGPGAGAALRW